MVTLKDNMQELFSSLEAVMVNEFRLSQSLCTLTQEERQALLDGKVEVITAITEKKEAVLDELGRAEDIRQKVTEQLIRLSGMGEYVENLAQLLPRIESPVAERIGRLREGILSLQGEIREMNRGNYALATLNLERLGALQNFLINLYSTNSTFYQPAGAANRAQSTTTISMDHRA
jgi:flagellar biosynthesis/type III secretory pathway chaperone